MNECLLPSLWEVLPHISIFSLYLLFCLTYSSANPWDTFPISCPSYGHQLLSLLLCTAMLLKSFASEGPSASSLTISPQTLTHLSLSPAHHCSMQNCSFWCQVCCMRGRQAEHWRDIHWLPLLGHQKDRQKIASKCLESGESGVYWVLTLACDTSHSAQPYKEPGDYLQSSFIISCNCHHKFITKDWFCLLVFSTHDLDIKCSSLHLHLYHPMHYFLVLSWSTGVSKTPPLFL